MGYGARIAGPASDIRPCPCAGFFTVEGTGRLDRALPYGSPCGCMVERRAENSMEAGLSTQKENRNQAREQEKGRGSSRRGREEEEVESELATRYALNASVTRTRARESLPRLGSGRRVHRLGLGPRTCCTHDMLSKHLDVHLLFSVLYPYR